MKNEHKTLILYKEDKNIEKNIKTLQEDCKNMKFKRYGDFEVRNKKVCKNKC